MNCEMPVRRQGSWLRKLCHLLPLALLAGFLAPAPHGAVRADEPKLQLADQLGLGGFGDEDSFGPKVEYSARIEAQNGGPSGRVVVTAKIAPDWHVYSLTQKKGGPQPTKFELQSDPPVTLKGAYQPDKPAAIHHDETWPGLDLEEHSGTVVWRAAVELPAGIDPSAFEVKLKVRGQVCNASKGCVQVSQVVPVKLTGFAPGRLAGGTAASTSEAPPRSDRGPPTAAPAVPEKPFAAGPYRGRNSHVEWSGVVRWKSSGGKANYELVLQAAVDAGWHVYPFATSDASGLGQGKPTLATVTAPAGWKLGEAKTNAAIHKQEIAGLPPSEYHDGQVTWTAPLVASGNGSGELRGFLGFQTCSDANCDQPSGAEFAVQLPDPAQNDRGELAISFRPSSYKAVTTALAGKPAEAPARSGADQSPSAGAKRTWKVEVATGGEGMTLWSALTLAFVGGFLLNFMPCVLPVIGLKVVAFVQQSQGSRKEAFLLNLYYSLGLISVFMVLAAFAAVPQWFGRTDQLGWGQQFQSTTFNTIMAAVVFVFALSMLGVWEIPVPGFLGAGKAAEIAGHGGYWGAFAKGVFTTVMATPCTGPFMGSALTWAFTQKPPIIYATFFALGLGMALPYLVTGIFPQLMKFLPKPGAWMDTFKQLMGFVLLATVVFIFSFMQRDMVVPVVGLLVGLGMGCWWIGRTPIYAETSEKTRAWISAITMAAAIGWLSFAFLAPSKALLPWQSFSRTELEKHLDEGRTVMVDFTADWCLTCKTNERIALNINRTLEIVKENDIVVIKADKTEDNAVSEAIDQLLVDLGHKSLSIPYLVIFPADPAKPPIAFDGPVTPGMIAQALRDAGPSRVTNKSLAKAP